MPNLTRPVGRPTDYRPEYIDLVDAYLQTTGRENMHLPKIVSFARFIGVAKNTLYEWAKVHPEFQDALNKIMEAQEESLEDDGIYGGNQVNATIVKLLLQNNHGMRERQDITSEDKKLETLVIIKDGDTPK